MQIATRDLLLPARRPAPRCRPAFGYRSIPAAVGRAEPRPHRSPFEPTPADTVAGRRSRRRHPPTTLAKTIGDDRRDLFAIDFDGCRNRLRARSAHRRHALSIDRLATRRTRLSFFVRREIALYFLSARLVAGRGRAPKNESAPMLAASVTSSKKSHAEKRDDSLILIERARAERTRCKIGRRKHIGNTSICRRFSVSCYAWPMLRLAPGEDGRRRAPDMLRNHAIRAAILNQVVTARVHCKTPLRPLLWLHLASCVTGHASHCIIARSKRISPRASRA